MHPLPNGTATSTDPGSGSREEILLRASGLRKAFGGLSILDGVGVELRSGEVVLLRGHNGSGKTTLLNILTGNIEPDAGRIELHTNSFAERFEFPRRWWRNLNPFDHFTPERVARERVGRTWQDIRLFATQDLQTNIAVAAPDQLGENPAWAILRHSSVRSADISNLSTSAKMLSRLGLDGRGFSSADRISFGQAKRVAIARAIRAGARILFLDEPFAGLDAAGISQVMDLLRTLAKEHKVTLVIVEHMLHLQALLEIVDTVWTLTNGTLDVQQAGTVRRERTVRLGSDWRQLLTERAPGTGTIHELPLYGGATLTIHRRAGSDGPSSLEVSNLVVSRGKRPIIGCMTNGRAEGISFNLQQGDVAILQAPNGWGKTTLLETLAGILPSRRGAVTALGRRIDNSRPWEVFRLGVTLLRSRDHFFPNLTGLETLRLTSDGAAMHGLDNLLCRKMADLSGGERQLIALVAALRCKTSRLHLLDEPFQMLDDNAVRLALTDLFARPTITVLIAVPGGTAGGLCDSPESAPCPNTTTILKVQGKDN